MKPFYYLEDISNNDEDNKSLNNLLDDDHFMKNNDEFNFKEFDLKYSLPSLDDFKLIFHNDNNSINETKGNDIKNRATISHLYPFNISNPLKRGKKYFIRKKKYEHKSTDFDNLQRKVQVHFLTFIINLSNDALVSILGTKTNYHFKQIHYELKKQISHEFVKKLKSSNIKELFKMKISPKNKCHKEYINLEILNEVCNKSKILDKFFNINYLEFFNNFYFNEAKNINKIIFEGKEINFSYRTKPFYDLIEKYQKHANLLIENTKSVYFYGYNSLIKNNPFTTKNNELDEIQLKE